MNIEIFPAEKSCEQGCSICPMARKDKIVTAEAIDSEVQKSFSLIEKLLGKKNIMYDMHFTSAFHLFPKVAYPSLIRMSRFETSKDVRLNGNVQHFSNGIKKLLSENSIDPQIVGFSVVPFYPVISAEDADLIDNLIKEISSWHFLSEYKGIDVTVRSNLITEELFKEASGDLFNADKRFLKKMLSQHAVLTRWKRRSPLRDFKNERLYHNRFRAQNGTHRITLTNRVLSPKEVSRNVSEFQVEQALSFVPKTLKVADFAIAPKGVMIMHSSVSINNPVMWLSHEDFRQSLEITQRDKKFSVLAFIQNLIIQNRTMYRYVGKYKNVTDKDFPLIFETFRPTMKFYF